MPKSYQCGALHAFKLVRSVRAHVMITGHRTRDTTNGRDVEVEEGRVEQGGKKDK